MALWRAVLDRSVHGKTDGDHSPSNEQIEYTSLVASVGPNMSVIKPQTRIFDYNSVKNLWEDWTSGRTRSATQI